MVNGVLRVRREGVVAACHFALDDAGCVPLFGPGAGASRLILASSFCVSALDFAALDSDWYHDLFSAALHGVTSMTPRARDMTMRISRSADQDTIFFTGVTLSWSR
jgi:hypothetical protein